MLEAELLFAPVILFYLVTVALFETFPPFGASPTTPLEDGPRLYEDYYYLPPTARAALPASPNAFTFYYCDCLFI